MFFENAKMPALCGYTTLWVRQPWGWLEEKYCALSALAFGWGHVCLRMRSSWAVSQSRIRKVNKIWESKRAYSALQQATNLAHSRETLELLAAVAVLHPNLSFTLFHVHSTANRPWWRDILRARKSFSHIALCLQTECAVCFFVLLKVLLCFFLIKHTVAKMFNLLKNSTECSSFISSGGRGNYSSWAVDESVTSWSHAGDKS